MIGNPFLYRAADSRRGSLSEIRRFVNLFGVSALGLIKEHIANIWNIPVIILSAPGAGKSSLMRIFSTTATIYISDTASSGGNQEALAKWMEDLGVFKDGRPYALGIWIRMSEEYHFQDHEAGSQQNGLFCSLLNTRLILRALIGICDWKKFSIDHDDLSRVKLDLKPQANTITSEAWKKWGAYNGKDLYDKMVELEAQLCDMRDDPFWEGNPSLLSHPGLWSLDLFANLNIEIDQEPFCFKPLVMLDDLHELTTKQSKYIFSLLVSRQINIPFWISLRKQALDLQSILTQQLDKGVEQNRDFEPIDLDTVRRPSDFKKLALEISKLRVHDAGSQIGSLSHTFIDFISEDNKDNIFLDSLNEKVAQEIKERIIKTAGTEIKRFIGLINGIDQSQFETHEKCRKLRNLEIFIRRELSKPQMYLAFHQTDSNDFQEYEKKRKFGNVEELFLSIEYKLPYYFGASRLITLSSNNILQFLRIAGALFEEIMTAIRLGKDRETFLIPKKQHEIISKTAKDFYNEIPRSVRYGNEVFRLIQAVGYMCKHETYRPTAPYDPGVTGFAITMYDLKILVNGAKNEDEEYLTLYQAIESAVAHNILIPTTNYKCKGKSFLVLYINRLLCVPFKLPLQKGGFREQKLETLITWMKSGYRKEGKEKNIGQMELC